MGLRLIRIAACLLPLLGAPALAGTQGASPMHADTGSMCRSECLASAATRPGGPRADAAQACAIRCAEAQPPANAVERVTPIRRSARLTVASTRPARPRTPLPLHGVLYAARAPSGAFGLVVGDTDRMAAHEAAERECAASGTGCRVLTEFTEACGAAAVGVLQSPWASFVAADPETAVVTSIAGGSGDTQARAEQRALADCRASDPQAECYVIAAVCSRGG